MRAIFIGLIVGILISVVSTLGILICNWNPAHYIEKGLLCKTASIFYWPIIPQSLIVFRFVEVDGLNATLPFLIMNLITIAEFILLSLFISWIYKKTNSMFYSRRTKSKNRCTTTH